MSIPLAGLVGAYPLNGNALDVSGRNHHGAIMAVTPTRNRFCTPVGIAKMDDHLNHRVLGGTVGGVESLSTSPRTTDASLSA
jgi:hypothetical protein